MADFTPKKVSTEKGKARGGEGPAVGGSRDAEHQAPPVIHLEHHHLEKLGMTKMPPVGSKIKISGLAHVGATSEGDQSARFGGGAAEGGKPHRSMTLHLHKMDVGGGNNSGTKEVDQEAEKAKGAKAEMDKALKREMGGRKSKDSAGEEEAGGLDETPRGSNGPRG
jgi:hypothetical protein